MMENGRFYTKLFAASKVLFILPALIISIACSQPNSTPPQNPTTPRPIEPQNDLPIFPGAEGFGTQTRAGRGGKVIEVTSLANEGPGSLRAALDDPSPRIIIFRVGGIIELETPLFINHPYVTVAGQTAPGDGICLKNAGIVITSHDILLQHLRIRPGNEGPVKPEDNDAIAILGQHANFDGAYNVVLDHISASWSEDEIISTWYGAHDITISWSIISEALNKSRHREGGHSAGLLIGDSSYHVSVHHSLLAHNDFRNPFIKEGGTHDFVNNVIYDWGVLAAEITDFDANTFLNFIGNSFISGPSSAAEPFEILVNEGNPQIYVEGNLGPHRLEPTMDEWALVGFDYGEEGTAPTQYRSHTQFTTPSITTTDASTAMTQVLTQAGATAPHRDTVDQRVVADVDNVTGAIINSPADVGGYPALTNGIPPRDFDHDGMPDAWEQEMGLNPQDATDGNSDRDEDGYTNIEEYLHSLS